MKNIKNCAPMSLFLAIIFSLTLGSGNLNAQDLNQTLIRSLDLHVSSSCVNGAAVFKIRNIGLDRLESVNFKLFKVFQKQVVSKRRMSLNTGQTATFKVKNANKIPDMIGLFVDSKLVKRDQKVDVAIQCTS